MGRNDVNNCELFEELVTSVNGSNDPGCPVERSSDSLRSQEKSGCGGCQRIQFLIARLLRFLPSVKTILQRELKGNDQFATSSFHNETEAFGIMGHLTEPIRVNLLHLSDPLFPSRACIAQTSHCFPMLEEMHPIDATLSPKA